MPPTKPKRKVISLDTETTGLDLHHGCGAFFVTSCDDQGEVTFWEWRVDPLTRRVKIPPEDLVEIRELIKSADELVFHNSKFDVAVISLLLPDLVWPWGRIHDTIVAAHLLDSSQPKDLTSLTMNYLGVDIQPYEDVLEGSVKECRRAIQLAKTRKRRVRKKSQQGYLIENEEDTPDDPLAEWRIGSGDDPLLPSSTQETWQCDYWLPAATADHHGLPDDDPLRGVLRDYANRDSESTMLLWSVLRREMESRGLWKIYEERMRCVPVTVGMERRGVGINQGRTGELRGEYVAESSEMGSRCVTMARDHYGYDLVLPKGASPNDSLRTFVYDHLRLEPRYSKKSKTGAPSLDKEAIQHYLDTLDHGSKELGFIETLIGKRKRDTFVSYMDSYRRYWIQFEGDDCLVFPSLNMVGTKTLRWSSENPNEQSVSKRGLFEGDTRTLRYLFGPLPGREWCSLDAKNVELRIPAYESGEEELIALFERPDDPPYYGSEHLLNFHTVYPDVWDDSIGRTWEWDGKNQGRRIDETLVGPYVKKRYEAEWYKYVKNGGFALGYGAGIQTADRAFRRPGSFARLKERFARKEQLNQRYIRMADELGYVETIPDRSVDPSRGYPIVLPRDERGRIKPTLPLNYHVQSTAMQWTNRAMVRVAEFFDRLNRGELFRKARWPGGYYIAIQQHDEIVVDAPARRIGGREPWTYNRPVFDEVARTMARGGDDIGVPTPVGVEYHERNWGEGVTLA